MEKIFKKTHKNNKNKMVFKKFLRNGKRKEKIVTSNTP